MIEPVRSSIFNSKGSSFTTTYRTIFFFDLDCTLTREELIPLIGRLDGLETILRKRTRDAMLFSPDFSSSFLERVSLLAHLSVSTVQNVVRKVELLDKVISWIQKNTDKCFVVTGNLDIWIDPLIKDIGVNYFSSKAYVSNNTVIVDEVIDKAIIVSQFSDFYRVYVGDGMNDVSAMSCVEIGIATEIVHEAPDALWSVAKYAVKKEESLCQILSRL